MANPNPATSNNALEREMGDTEVATSFAGDDGHDEKAHLRAATEDDDGYDPYSDRRDDEPLFERDPWK